MDPNRGRRRGSRRHPGIGVLSLLALMAATALAWRVMIHAPASSLTAMNRAFQMLNTEQGASYAPGFAKLADSARQAAIERWQMEDERLFFLRRYDEVDSLSRVAEAYAVRGIKRAQAVKDSIRTRNEIGLAVLRDRMAEMTSQLERLPQESSLRGQIVEAQAHLINVENRQREGDLLGGAEALRRATSALDRAGIRFDHLFAEYFDAVPLWKSWAAETVAWSKSHRSVALVVDKMAHLCHVYSNGKLAASFAVDLGPQWVGPKRFEGDMSTPEGRYRIRRKRGPGETIYYRALEINYPNENDRRRFVEAKRNATLPPDARLGGNIELHGRGGKTFGWTKGCIALDDEDMLTLYHLVDVGTPVTIVGALEHPFPSQVAQATGSFDSLDTASPFVSSDQ